MRLLLLVSKVRFLVAFGYARHRRGTARGRGEFCFCGFQACDEVGEILFRASRSHMAYQDLATHESARGRGSRRRVQLRANRLQASPRAARPIAKPFRF